MLTPGRILKERVPFGHFTVISVAVISTDTPFAIVTGSFPIRDIEEKYK